MERKGSGWMNVSTSWLNLKKMRLMISIEWSRNWWIDFPLKTSFRLLTFYSVYSDGLVENMDKLLGDGFERVRLNFTGKSWAPFPFKRSCPGGSMVVWWRLKGAESCWLSSLQKSPGTSSVSQIDSDLWDLLWPEQGQGQARRRKKDNWKGTGRERNEESEPFNLGRVKFPNPKFYLFLWGSKESFFNTLGMLLKSWEVVYRCIFPKFRFQWSKFSWKLSSQVHLLLKFPPGSQ